MHRLLRHGFAILLAAFFLSIPCARAAQGPLEALAAAQKAIDDSDITLFNKVVDVDAILNKGSTSALEILGRKLRDGEFTAANPVFALALSGMTQDPSKIEILRVLLHAEVKKYVAAGISGGYFSGKPNGKAGSGAFSGLLQGLSMERKEIVPGKVLSHKGNTAVVSATLMDGGSGKFPLELGLAQEGEQWRVTEVANVNALLDSALKQGRSKP